MAEMAGRGAPPVAPGRGRSLPDERWRPSLPDGRRRRVHRLRGVNTLNLGACAVCYWPLRKGLSTARRVYRIPAVHFRGRAVLTNTAPAAVYRSAGRPEVIHMIERRIDLAADEHGFDRVALRHAPDEGLIRGFHPTASGSPVVPGYALPGYAGVSPAPQGAKRP